MNLPNRAMYTQTLRRSFVAAASSTAGLLILGSDQVVVADAPALQVNAIRCVGPSEMKHFEPWISENPRDASNLVILAALYLGTFTDNLAVHSALRRFYWLLIQVMPGHRYYPSRDEHQRARDAHEWWTSGVRPAEPGAAPDRGGR